jgi:hypothetical protein
MRSRSLLLTQARKLNTSPSTIEDKEALKKMLTTPPVKKIDLHFPLGLEVTARNLKGVTVKDALDAIYKQYKKKVSRRQQIERHDGEAIIPSMPLTHHAGRRRARKPRARWIRVGQGRIMDPTRGTPEERRRSSLIQEEQEEQGRGGLNSVVGQSDSATCRTGWQGCCCHC